MHFNQSHDHPECTMPCFLYIEKAPFDVLVYIYRWERIDKTEPTAWKGHQWSNKCTEEGLPIRDSRAQYAKQVSPLFGRKGSRTPKSLFAFGVQVGFTLCASHFLRGLVKTRFEPVVHRSKRSLERAIACQEPGRVVVVPRRLLKRRRLEVRQGRNWGAQKHGGIPCGCVCVSL